MPKEKKERKSKSEAVEAAPADKKSKRDKSSKSSKKSKKSSSRSAAADTAPVEQSSREIVVDYEAVVEEQPVANSADPVQDSSAEEAIEKAAEKAAAEKAATEAAAEKAAADEAAAEKAAADEAAAEKLVAEQAAEKAAAAEEAAEEQAALKAPISSVKKAISSVTPDSDLKAYVVEMEARLMARIEALEKQIASGNPSAAALAPAAIPASSAVAEAVPHSTAAASAGDAPVSDIPAALASAQEGHALRHLSGEGSADDLPEAPAPVDPGQKMPGWLDSIPADFRKLIITNSLEEKTFWRFRVLSDEKFGPDEVNALAEGLTKLPEGRVVTKLDFDLSSDDVRLRHGKDLGAAIATSKVLKEVTVRKMRRQAGWSMLTHAADLGFASVESLVLDGLELLDGWSGAQATKVLTTKSLKKFALVNGICPKPLSRSDINLIYDSIASGFQGNTSIEEVAIKNMPGFEQGDISRFFDKLQRNTSLKKVSVCDYDLFDRLKAKSLADYLTKAKQLEELHVQGVDSTFFDVGDVIEALERHPNLKVLNATPFPNPTGGKARGLRADQFRIQKLQKIVDNNPKLRIFVWTEADKNLCIYA